MQRYDKFKLIKSLYMYVHMSACIYVHSVPVGAFRGQRVPDPLKLELEAVVSHLMWVRYEHLTI